MRLRAALILSALVGCGDTRVVMVEDLPTTAQLKVVAWDDGLSLQAALRPIDEPTTFPLTEILEGGRTMSVWIFPFTVAELTAAVPGLVGLPDAEILSGVSAAPGAPTRIPGDSEVLEARLVEEGELDDGEYTRTPRAAFDTRPGAPKIGLTVVDALACRALATPDVIEIPGAFNPTAITAQDGEHLLIAGTTGTVTFQLLDVSVDGVRRRRVSGSGVAGPSRSIGWDGRSLWGHDRGSGIFRVTLEGERVPFAAPPVPRVGRMSIGRDGSVVAIAPTDPDGGIPTLTYDPRRDRWSSVTDVFNTSIQALRAYRHDRYMAHINCWTRSWDFDPNLGQSHWGVERAPETSCQEPRDLALDDGHYYFLSSQAALLVGDDSGASWQPRPHGLASPTAMPWPEVLAPMENGRVAVGGSLGRVEVWIGDRWCVPPAPAPTINITLAAGFTDTAWFVGANDSGAVRAVRLRVARAE